jgi:hypothetical protein
MFCFVPEDVKTTKQNTAATSRTVGKKMKGEGQIGSVCMFRVYSL